MDDNKKFSAFNDPTYLKHKDEAKKRWGNTDAYKQSRERVGKMTKKELDEVKAEGEAITNAIADLMKRGFVFDSSEVQKEIGRHYKHLSRFYEPNYEMYKGLGKMYVEDPRFTKYYEKIAVGLAKFMQMAMEYYADNRHA